MSKPAAPEILCLGCVGVGKTNLIKQLKQLKQPGRSASAAAEPEEPTVGVELDRMTLGDRTAVVVREVGAAMMATWPSYVPACRCLMFVVDRSNHAQLASAVAELHKLIALLPAATPVVVVLNKCDRPESFLIPRATVDMALQLDSIRHHRQRALPLASSTTSIVTLVENVSARNVHSLQTLASVLAAVLSG